MTADDIDDATWNRMTHDARAEVLGEDNPFRVTLRRNLSCVSRPGLFDLMKMLDRDTRLGWWLLRETTLELHRRNKGELCEARMLAIDFSEWESMDVADALLVCHVMTYRSRDVAAGAVWDAVNRAVVGEAHQRLRRMES